MRTGPQPLALSEAFYVLVNALSGQQNQWREGARRIRARPTADSLHTSSLPLSLWDAPILHSSPSTEGWLQESEKQRRLRRPHARSRCSFITPCASEWLVKIQGPTGMSASIAIGLSKLYIDGQRNLDTLSKLWRLFLRKAVAYFAKDSG